MNNHRPIPVLLALALSVGVLLPAAGRASAEPPSNDDAAGATVVGPAPFAVQQDTTEATTSEEESALNAFCGAPVLAQGVWFVTTAASTETLVFDVSGSDYTAGILALDGERGGFAPLTCGPGEVRVHVSEGQTIHLLVFGDGISEQTSGNLSLVAGPAPPPPELTLTIDPRGSADWQGTAEVSGTVTCTSVDPGAGLIGVFGSVHQRVGRFFIDGFFDSSVSFVPCDGVTRPWTGAVEGTGRFSGGRAEVTVSAFACAGLECVDASADATVKLDRSATPTER